MKYLHIMVPSKRMMLGFVSMLRTYFPSDEHTILYRGAITESERILSSFDNTLDFASFGKGKIRKFKGLNKIMKEADHIVLHGFNMDIKWILFLYTHKKFLKKSSWLIWGIDLYNYLRPNTSIKNRILNHIETVCRKIVPVPVALNEADIPIYNSMIHKRGVCCASYPISEENWEIMDNYLMEQGVLDQDGNVIPPEQRVIPVTQDEEQPVTVPEDEQASIEENEESPDPVQNSDTDYAEELSNDDQEDNQPSPVREFEKLINSMMFSDERYDPEKKYKFTMEMTKSNTSTSFTYRRDVLPTATPAAVTTAAVKPDTAKSDKNEETHEEHIVKIIVGNNAHHFNKHQQILMQLRKFRNQNIKLYIPLSYGNDYITGKKGYVESIKKYITNEYPDQKRTIMSKLLEQKVYTKLLTELDIGIFPADRQNALGNINKMLYLGKKVYLSKKNPMYDFYISKGFEIHDVEELKTTTYEKLIQPISVDYPNPWVKNYYSFEGSARLWQNVFDCMEGKAVPGEKEV